MKEVRLACFKDMKELGIIYLQYPKFSETKQYIEECKKYYSDLNMIDVDHGRILIFPSKYQIYCLVGKDYNFDNSLVIDVDNNQNSQKDYFYPLNTNFSKKMLEWSDSLRKSVNGVISDSFSDIMNSIRENPNLIQEGFGSSRYGYDAVKNNPIDKIRKAYPLTPDQAFKKSQPLTDGHVIYLQFSDDGKVWEDKRYDTSKYCRVSYTGKKSWGDSFPVDKLNINVPINKRN